MHGRIILKTNLYKPAGLVGFYDDDFVRFADHKVMNAVVEVTTAERKTNAWLIDGVRKGKCLMTKF
jgi:hypothetical protein